MNNENQTGQALSKAGQLSREKTWEESSVEEKLEKMRREIRGLYHRFEAINRLSNDIEKLMKHEHGAKGEIMVRMERDYGSIGGLGNTYEPLK